MLRQKSGKGQRQKQIKLNGKEIQFVRYGGLSPVKQTSFGKSKVTPHTAPTRAGTYAFTWPFIEPYLLGGRGPKDPHRKFTNDGKLVRPRVFTYHGDLYHHLDVPKEQVIHRTEYWVKTSFEHFAIALNKYIHSEMSAFWADFGNKQTYQVRPRSKIFKDYLEVFISAQDGKIT